MSNNPARSPGRTDIICSVEHVEVCGLVLVDQSVEVVMAGGHQVVAPLSLRVVRPQLAGGGDDVALRIVSSWNKQFRRIRQNI